MSIPLFTADENPTMSAFNSRITAANNAIYNILPTKTITDVAVASFTDGADGIPVKALTAAIQATQAGSGDPSPDNVRTISGFSAVNITANGDTYAIDWTNEAGTVYWGNITLSGDGEYILTVTRIGIVLDNRTWTAQSYGWNTINIGGIQSSPSVAAVMAEKYKVVKFADLSNTPNSICVGITGGGRRLACNTTEQPTGLLVTPLATPQTYTLTNMPEIVTAYGNNSISADTGNITLTYRADIGLLIGG